MDIEISKLEVNCGDIIFISHPPQLLPESVDRLNSVIAEVFNKFPYTGARYILLPFTMIVASVKQADAKWLAEMILEKLKQPVNETTAQEAK